MNSNDENFSDYYRSAPGIETNLRDESVHSINSNENSKICPFTVSHSSTSFTYGSIPTSAVLQIPLSGAVEEVSIYDIRTNLQRNLILAVFSMIAFLLPLCDTIYLPALNTIRDNLNTSDTLVAISVSIYLFMSGLFSLIWGSISDRFGRKITIIVALIIFVAASIVCIFAPNIVVLIVFRAIEGGTVSATLVVGQALVADIYPEERRGSAAGFFFLPFNIGPVVGPLIGGPLSGAFGWRSTFIFLTIFSCFILVVMFVLVPETHQYFTKERFQKANPNKRIIDAVPNEIPLWEKPWKPLTYLADLTIVPYMAVSTTTFVAICTSYTLLPTHLHETPYSYTETMIGVLFAPSGIALITGSLLGGWLSDKASKHYGHERCPEGRLVPALAFSILTPIGLIIYGWTLHYKLNLAGPLIGIILLSFGQSVFEVNVSTYLTIRKQKEAAAVSAANVFLNTCAAGIIVTIAVPLEYAIGTGPYFSLICGINVVTIGLTSILVFKRIRSHVAEQQNGMTPGLKNPL